MGRARTRSRAERDQRNTMPEDSTLPHVPAQHDVEAARRATREAFRTVFPGVMVAMFLAAADQTVLASALPAIASALHGVADLSWVVVGYLLAATVAAPVYGHLGDAFGRRRLLLGGLGVFAVASVACALAPTLPALIAARVLQGLGGGGLMTMAQAIIGENIPPRERGRFGGYFAALFAMSSMFGPVMGAYLTEHFGWRSVFVVNVPLGALAWLLALRIPVTHRPRARRFRPDVGGVVLFAASTALLLFALSSAGHRFAWTSWPLYALLALALLGLFALVRWEQRHEDPVIPVRFLEVPAILRSDAVVFFFAAALFSTILYLPIYLQLGRGVAIGESGLLLLPITLSMVVASAVTGRRVAVTGRATAYPRRGLTAATLALAALALLLGRLDTHVVVALTMVIGAGLGTVMSPTQVIVQHAAGHEALGSATASIAISRAIGGAVGVALVGAIVFVAGATHGDLGSTLAQAMEGGPAFIRALGASQRATLAAELDQAFRIVFAVIACMTAAGALVSLTVPKPRW